MPPFTTIEMKKKRPSVTDNMCSPAEKILSAVDRKLIKILDSEFNGAELNKYWKSASPPLLQPCIVVVPGPEGASKYIFNIRERLKYEGFRFDGGAKLWYRGKVPNQPTLQTLQEQAECIKNCVARK